MHIEEITWCGGGKYGAGDDGNIYACRRSLGFGRNAAIPWTLVPSYETKSGYLQITLYHDAVREYRRVARLVCQAYHGAPPSELHQVRHLDGNKKNNVPGNLAWGTAIDNWADRKAHGHGAEGAKCGKAIYSDTIRAAAQEMWYNGNTNSQISSQLGIRLGNVHQIVANKYRWWLPIIGNLKSPVVAKYVGKKTGEYEAQRLLDAGCVEVG